MRGEYYLNEDLDRVDMPSRAGQVQGRVVQLVVLIDHEVLGRGLEVKDRLDDLILVILSRQMDDGLPWRIDLELVRSVAVNSWRNGVPAT